MPVALDELKLDLDRKWTPCTFSRWVERFVLTIRELMIEAGGGA